MIPKKASLTCTTWILSLAYFIRSSYRRAAFSAHPLSHGSSSVNLTPNKSVLGNAHTAELWNNCEQDAATFLRPFFPLEKPVHSRYHWMNVICSLMVKLHTNIQSSKAAQEILPKQNKEAHIVALKWPDNCFSYKVNFLRLWILREEFWFPGVKNRKWNLLPRWLTRQHVFVKKRRNHSSLALDQKVWKINLTIRSTGQTD